MINFRRFSRLFAASFVVVASFGGAAIAQGQAVISGRVTDEAGNGIPAVNVVIPTLGTGVGASTDANGNYKISLGSNAQAGQSIVITVRRIGYAPQSRNVTVTGGTATENFTLSQQVRQLDEVIVSGVAEATSQRNLTISVGKVGEQQLKDVPPKDAVSALAGKVSGVRVAMTQGVPGSTPAIRVRTSAVLGVGANEPLFIVDGVISTNGIARGHRLDDFLRHASLHHDIGCAGTQIETNLRG